MTFTKSCLEEGFTQRPIINFYGLKQILNEPFSVIFPLVYLFLMKYVLSLFCKVTHANDDSFN